MAKEETFTCDCGCEAAATHKGERRGWFKLDQYQQQELSNEPKLDRRLHFASLACLTRWARLAKGAVTRMQYDAAAIIGSRGPLRNRDVIGLHL